MVRWERALVLRVEEALRLRGESEVQEPSRERRSELPRCLPIPGSRQDLKSAQEA